MKRAPAKNLIPVSATALIGLLVALTCLHAETTGSPPSTTLVPAQAPAPSPPAAGAGAAAPTSSGQQPPDSASTPAVRSGWIDAEGGKLYYEEAGSGDPIVLIHDGLLDSRVWDAQFAAFAPGHRVVRYDRRGYGRSPKPEHPYSRIDDLNRLFEQLGIERATVMGISSGGGLTIDFTLAHPEKVKMLILVGAVVSGFGYSDHMFTRGGHLTTADRASPEAEMEYWAIKDPYEIAAGNEEAKRKAKRILEENPQDLDHTGHSLERGPDRPALPNLHEIAVPVLVMAGEEDIPDVHAHAGAIAAGIPGAARVVVRGAGHLVPLEKPDAFDEEVLRFMSEGEFMRLLNTSGVAEAVKYFEEGRRKDPKWEPLTEERMNRLGYRYLLTDRTDTAIELFELNVAAHPDSWNAHDSLGEAYAKSGDRERAIASYRKSLELNPGNKNAVEKLAALEKE
ncbi:MAG TPA: alpha/beta fold hydrolase [Candidatus Saccharimonadales bacterium]|nr:alpha/beta fold hydrolase [Candidatus Saccharimonadales bacterium]